jgi:hypothetical protein
MARASAAPVLLLVLILLLALSVPITVQAYRGPHGKARLRGRSIAAGDSAGGDPILVLPPTHGSGGSGLGSGLGSTWSVPHRQSTLPRTYDLPAVLCVMSGCIEVILGGEETEEQQDQEQRRLCADTPATAPGCRPLPGGPGAPSVRLVNVGHGVATAMEFVAVEAWR